MHAVAVDIHRPLDASPARFAHMAPVFKRIGNQRISGQGGDGVVPVLYFHRGEPDIGHAAVGAVFRHFQPVADIEHAVGRKLDAGHQAQNRVFKHQHQHRRHRAQAAEQNQRRLAEQKRNQQNHNADRSQKLNGLHEPAHRKMLRQIAAEQISLQRVEQCKNSKQAKHQAPNIGERNQAFAPFARRQPNAQLHRQQHALNGERQIAKQPLLAQNIQKKQLRRLQALA